MIANELATTRTLATGVKWNIHFINVVRNVISEQQMWNINNTINCNQLKHIFIKQNNIRQNKLENQIWTNKRGFFFNPPPPIGPKNQNCVSYHSHNREWFYIYFPSSLSKLSQRVIFAQNVKGIDKKIPLLTRRYI